MQFRGASIERKTKETSLALHINLDESGPSVIDTGIGFLNHMLELLVFHAGVQLTLTCQGDVRVDGHHTTEDIGIIFGAALREALGSGKGIRRYGQSLLPMDESLVLVALDISGRSGCYVDLHFSQSRLGDWDTELLEEFFTALCRSAQCTLHLKQMAGGNNHHLAEACFKGFGRALREAVTTIGESESVPSSKGVLL